MEKHFRCFYLFTSLSLIQKDFDIVLANVYLVKMVKL